MHCTLILPEFAFEGHRPYRGRFAQSLCRSKQSDVGVSACHTVRQLISKQLCRPTSTPVRKSEHARSGLVLQWSQ